jgi:hypothetical protein
VELLVDLITDQNVVSTDDRSSDQIYNGTAFKFLMSN